MPHVRNSIKAVIVQDGHMLFTKMYYPEIDDTFYLLPGGGQRHGETFPVALRRECLEETGAEVEVGPLLLVREYIGKNHQRHAYRSGGVHQVEYMFRCTLRTPLNYEAATEHDAEQVGLVWLPLKELSDYNIYPAALAGCFDTQGNCISSTIYMGDVN